MLTLPQFYLPAILIGVLLIIIIAKMKYHLRVKRIITLIALISLMTIILYIPIRLYCFQQYKLASHGMEPFMLHGDYFLVDKIHTYLSSLNYGDVVSFVNPEDTGNINISRIIALGGDRISITKREVFVNGEHVRLESAAYYNQQMFPAIGSQRDDISEMTVPLKHVFVLGDNRDKSHDSRHFNFLPEYYITGNVIFITMSYDESSGHIRWDRMLKSVSSKMVFEKISNLNDMHAQHSNLQQSIADPPDSTYIGTFGESGVKLFIINSNVVNYSKFQLRKNYTIYFIAEPIGVPKVRVTAKFYNNDVLIAEAYDYVKEKKLVFLPAGEDGFNRIILFSDCE